MSDTMLMPLFKSKAKQVKWNLMRLPSLPEGISQVETLEYIEARGNFLTKLPLTFCMLTNLKVLNLGKNYFDTFPRDIMYLENLEKLHLFDNEIDLIPDGIFGNLRKLKIVNLNSNKLKDLPDDLGGARSLEMISIDNNDIKEIPDSICDCSRLKEFSAAWNKLQHLPMHIGYCEQLRRLIVHHNQLEDLPESVCHLQNIKEMDLAVNNITILPTQFHKLNIKYLYTEFNQLLSERPIRSHQADEILPLKEMCARKCLREIEHPNSLLRRTIRSYPDVRELLSMSNRCALCNTSFLNIWLECVHFIDSHAHMGTKNVQTKIPIRALLCSYRCFNQEGHPYYGVAFPS